MERYEVDIMDVVSAFSLPKPKNREASHYVIPCPFCDEKKKEHNYGHLDVNIAKNTFRCVKCGASGGTLSFFCFLNGWEDDKANRAKAAETLATCAKNIFDIGETKYKPKLKVQEMLAPIEVRDKTYNALLDMLKLSKTHRQNLLDRGFTDEQIDAHKYRSAPMNNRTDICTALLRQGCVLKGVPGFHFFRQKWIFGTDAEPGFLVPFRDCWGRIEGLQKRYDETSKGKYRWISSRDMEFGTGACSWAHIVGSPRAESIIITEGGLKADVIHALAPSPVTVVAIPGVTATKNLAKMLDILIKKGNLNKIYTAFDMDYCSNPQVKAAYEQLLCLIQKLGLSYSVLLWDPSYKGLDDFLKEGDVKSRMVALKGEHFVLDE